MPSGRPCRWSKSGNDPQGCGLGHLRFALWPSCSNTQRALTCHNQPLQVWWLLLQPPPLPLVQAFCKSVEAHLAADPANVAVVHCKAGKGRTGTMLCCYLLHEVSLISLSNAMRDSLLSCQPVGTRHLCCTLQRSSSMVRLSALFSGCHHVLLCMRAESHASTCCCLHAWACSTAIACLMAVLRCA